MAFKLKTSDKAFGSNSVHCVKSVDLSNRKLSIIGSTEDLDRENDVILLKSWDLENYAKNPVILWAHNYTTVPIASATKIVKKYKPNQLHFDLKFPTEGLNPFADMILNLYNEKIINASSVGFVPHEWKPLEEKGKTIGRVFTKTELA